MGANDKSPPMRHMRKRSLTEPRRPRTKRRAGNAAAVASENTVVAVSMHPPPGRLDDGIASSSASYRLQPGTSGSSATPVVVVHFCGHCQKRFRSPGKLAQHEQRVHATGDAAFHCSFCPKQFSCQSKATEHERTHTGEKPYACSICPRRFAQKSDVAPHERTHTGEKPYACSMCPRGGQG